MGAWHDALNGFIYLGLLGFLLMLMLFMAGRLPLLDGREQHVVVRLLTLVMLGGFLALGTDWDIIPRLLMGVPLWWLVMWSVRRLKKR